MAKRIEFAELFMDRLQSGSEAELRSIFDKVDLALQLRFGKAPAPAKRKGRPPKAVEQISA